MTAEPRIAVLGLGNVLMGDDAAGPYAIELLRSRYVMPPEVLLEDLGTPGLDLLPHMAGPERIILVDTVRSEGAPGTLRLYRKDAILAHAPAARIGPHDPGVKETLLSLDFAGQGPKDVLLVGVIPESTDSTIGLSASVLAAMPAVLDAVLGELTELGHEPMPRVPPLDPQPWWERSVDPADSPSVRP